MKTLALFMGVLSTIVFTSCTFTTSQPVSPPSPPGRVVVYDPPSRYYYTTESYYFTLRNTEYSHHYDYDRYDHDGRRGSWGSQNQPVDDWRQHH
jgi:hypothetical protein